MSGSDLTMCTVLRLDNQPGIHNPVILMIGRAAVEQNDLVSHHLRITLL